MSRDTIITDKDLEKSVDINYNYDPYKADIIDYAKKTVEEFCDSDEFDVERIDEILRCFAIVDANETRVRKGKIKRKKLEAKYEKEIRKNGILGFLAGGAVVGGLVLSSIMAKDYGVPFLKGGEAIYKQTSEVCSDLHYGCVNYTNGYQFNDETGLVDYEDAVNDIMNHLMRSGLTQTQAEMGLKYVYGPDERTSTASERIAARFEKYYETQDLENAELIGKAK